jgi:hypothetical protein
MVQLFVEYRIYLSSLELSEDSTCERNPQVTLLAICSCSGESPLAVSAHHSAHGFSPRPMRSDISA